MTGLVYWLRPYGEALLALGRHVTVTSVLRSRTQQLRLWYARASNPFPVAPPGTSYHEYGRAFDLVGNLEDLHWLGKVWRAWGGTWSATDPIHFQA